VRECDGKDWRKKPRKEGIEIKEKYGVKEIEGKR
jgi:hypothetical protein